MKKTLPVFNIGHFRHFSRNYNFYADNFRLHVKQHDFTGKPHKHDFFMVVLFTRGSGVHEVDFSTYKIAPGSLFLLGPGQTHYWKLSDDADGLIFFHTQDFFDNAFTGLRLKDYAFFNSINNLPHIQLKKPMVPKITALFKEIVDEYSREALMKDEKLLSLVNLLYIDLSRLYKPKLLLNSKQYLSKLRLFEDLLDKNFKTVKSPAAYSEMMHMTERHLNRICKTCLNQTPTDIILDRIILEARRLMMQARLPVGEIAQELGYEDSSYFSRLFKKKTGTTAKDFRAKYH